MGTFVAAGTPSGAGGHPCQGLWHEPAGKPRVGVIATHYEVDFSEHYLAEPLTKRGIGFLGWNTRFRGAGAYFLLDPALSDIAEGVRWLRERVDTVVVLGNSGGASLMAAVPGDLFISLNAHPGRPDVLTAWLDPSVTDESDPHSRDPTLDMFAVDPPYDPSFVARYRTAQRARNDLISEWAREELRNGERMFCVHRTWADLRFRDLTIDPSDRAPGCYAGDSKRANSSPFGLAKSCTLRTWLDMWSLQDSRCRAERHLAATGVPSLVVQSTADQGCFPSDARAIYEAIGSADKQLEFIPGDHYFSAGNEHVADLIANWIHEHT